MSLLESRGYYDLDSASFAAFFMAIGMWSQWSLNWNMCFHHRLLKRHNQHLIMNAQVHFSHESLFNELESSREDATETESRIAISIDVKRSR